MRRDDCVMNIDTTLEQFNLLHKKAALLKIAASSIGIIKEKVDEENIRIGSSKFGGMPDLPTHLSFPKYENGYLTFLAQINLSEAKSYDKESLFPETGILYFFYDIIEQPWGMDKEDEESFQVYYFDGDARELARTPYPEITEDYFPLPNYKITFTDIVTFPEELNGLDLTEDELDNYYEFRESSQPRHYMFGEPFNIQNNVFEEIIYYESEAEADGKIKLRSKELVLLFQMDSDDDLNVMWGDSGKIYFCIDKKDLENKVFSKTKFTLQCY
jgi:uncharacterized protein YwqG